MDDGKEARVMVGVYLERETVDQIDAWAKRFGTSRSKMTGILVEGCIENEFFLVDCAARLSEAARLFAEAWKSKRPVSGKVA